MGKLAGALCVIASSAICQATVAAGLDGSEVTVAAYCCTAPIESDRFTIPVTRIVGSDLEFPSGSIVEISGNTADTNIDVGASSIDVGYNQVGVAASGSFNGFVFDFAGSNVPNIIGVTLDPLSTVLASSIGLTFDADSVFVNAAGLPIRPDTRILVDIAFAASVPEPRTSAMAIVGLLLLAAYRRAVFVRGRRVVWDSQA